MMDHYHKYTRIYLNTLLELLRPLSPTRTLTVTLIEPFKRIP